MWPRFSCVNASAPKTISTIVLSVISRVPGTGQSKKLVPTTSAKQISMDSIMPIEPSSTRPTARRRKISAHRLI